MPFQQFPYTNFQNLNLDWILEEIRRLIESGDVVSGVQSVNGQTGVVVITAAGLGAYVKPSGGIPKTDLANAVQTSLNKADRAYQKPSSGIPEIDLAGRVRLLLLPEYDQSDGNYFLRINENGFTIWDDYDTAIKAYINGQIATAISGVDELIGSGVIT